MSLYTELKARSDEETPKLAMVIIAALAIISVYLVGYDQGELFSLVQGNGAYDNMFLHEFTHDIRHATGFPCH